MYLQIENAFWCIVDMEHKLRDMFVVQISKAERNTDAVLATLTLYVSNV